MEENVVRMTIWEMHTQFQSRSPKGGDVFESLVIDGKCH
jgi:hypothetical protein